MPNRPIGHREIVELQKFNDGTLTESVLKDLFSRYNLLDALLALGNKSLEIYKNETKENETSGIYLDPRTNIIVTQFSLTYLANIFLISYSNPHKKKKLDYFDNVALLVNLYSNKLIDPTFTPEGKIIDYDSFVSFFIRMNYEQMRLQEPPLYPLARNIYIFNEIIKNDYLVNSTNIIELFEDKNGLTIPSFLTLSSMLVAGGIQKPFFNLDYFLKAKIPKFQHLLTEENINNIISFYSTDYQSFKTIDRKFNYALNSTYSKFRFNPLFICPIIRFKDDVTSFVIPNIFVLQHRISNSLYWWFDDYFNQNNQQSAFRSYYGNIFQKYVGIILKDIFEEDNVRSEFKYGKDKRRFIDWYILQENKVYLFETKSNQFNLHNNQIASKEKLVEEEMKKVIDAIRQINKRIEDINKFDELSFLRNKEIISIIVFLNMPFISLPLYDDWIKETLFKSEFNDLTYLPNKNLFMLNINEIELYGDVKEKVKIEQVFHKLSTDRSQSFLSIISRIKGENTLRNRFLDKIYSDFFQMN